MPRAGPRATFGGVNSTNNPSRPGRLRVSRLNGLRFDVLVVLAVEVALVVALHFAATQTSTVPLRSLGDWLLNADPTVALAATARLVALGIAYWLLTTTLLYALAFNLGWTSVTGVLRWVTLPVVRRVVQGVTAMSLTGASLLGPAAVSVTPVLAQSDAVVAQADGDDANDGVDDPADSGGYGIDAAGWPEPGSDGGFWRPNAVRQNQAEGAYTVVPHDHFWSIAESHLRQATGRDVTEDEVCQYWVKVVDANRQSIRSGDPDLIYPLETVTLPPVFGD